MRQISRLSLTRSVVMKALIRRLNRLRKSGSDSRAISTVLLSLFVVKLKVINGNVRPGSGAMRLMRPSRQSVSASRSTINCTKSTLPPLSARLLETLIRRPGSLPKR